MLERTPTPRAGWNVYLSVKAQSKMPRIFISYSRKDLGFVRRLAGDLEKAGYEVWWDPGDTQAGENWTDPIPVAIRSSQHFIVVLSPDSAQSERVENEYAQALAFHKEIVPVMLERSQAPFALNTINSIDFTSADYAANFNALLTALGYTAEDRKPVAASTPFLPLVYAIPIMIGAAILLWLILPLIFKATIPSTGRGTSTPTDISVAALTVSPTKTLTPSRTDTPTLTPSGTSTPSRTVRPSPKAGPDSLFCVYLSSGNTIPVRSGPSINYPPLGEPLSDGACLYFSARNQEGTWVQIAPDQPDDELQQYAGGWIPHGGIAVFVDGGSDPGGLPVVTLTQAPVRTPTFTRTPTRTVTHSGSAVACIPEYSLPVYLVQLGDTLSSIAGKTNSTVEELVRINCLPESAIYVGQPLYVPQTPIATPVPATPTETPDALQTLQAAFKEVDEQFEKVFRANIAYNVPKSMKLEDTVTIELLLKPSLYQEALATQLAQGNGFLTSTAEAGQLATQIVEERGLITSTAEPGQPVTRQGQEMDVATGDVIITPRMKAVLQSLKTGAFEIKEFHDSPEQPISSIDTTKWRWSVTAKEAGEQTLELVIYRLIKQGDNEYWREVEAYHAEINVQVTPAQRIRSLDWQWILGILVTALLIPLFFRWYDTRRKAADEPKPPKQPKRKNQKK